MHTTQQQTFAWALLLSLLPKARTRTWSQQNRRQYTFITTEHPPKNNFSIEFLFLEKKSDDTTHNLIPRVSTSWTGAGAGNEAEGSTALLRRQESAGSISRGSDFYSGPVWTWLRHLRSSSLLVPPGEWVGLWSRAHFWPADRETVLRPNTWPYNENLRNAPWDNKKPRGKSLAWEVNQWMNSTFCSVGGFTVIIMKSPYVK